jgi:tetratricopeptide (TPR) repeat protein
MPLFLSSVIAGFLFAEKSPLVKLIFKLQKTVGNKEKKVEKYLAKGQYWKALEIDPDCVEAFYQCGMADTTATAIHFFQQVINKNPSYKDVQYRLGYAYLRNGEFEKAISAFQEFIKQKTDDSRTYYYCGIAYNKLGNNSKAIEMWQRATELDHEQACLHLLEKGASVQGEKWAKQREAAKYVNEGNRQCNAKSYSAAIEQFQKAIAACPNCTMAYFGLGFVYWKQDRDTEAREQFLKAKNLDFFLGDAQFYLGYINYLAAVKDNRKYNTSKTYNGITNLKWAILYGCDRLGQAYYLLVKAAHISSQHIETLAEDIQLLRKSVAADPTYAAAWNELGIYIEEYQKNRCNEESVLCFKKAVELNPDYAEGWWNLGRATRCDEYMKKGRKMGFNSEKIWGEICLTRTIRK